MNPSDTRFKCRHLKRPRAIRDGPHPGKNIRGERPPWSPSPGLRLGFPRSGPLPGEGDEVRAAIGVRVSRS